MAEPLVPASRTEDTGLSLVVSGSTELAPSRTQAAEQFEIQSAIVMARKFPRNEDEAFAKLMRACDRTTFAESAAYSFPRGGQAITGPSVNLAREAARAWTNIRYGLNIIRDDSSSRQIEGWAWDLENNIKVTAQDDFAKLIQRKKKGGGTEWVPPDERDLRELTNRRGAICVRNCLLQILPKDLVEDALTRAEKTLKSGAERDPDGERKKLILAFSDLNVTPDMLEGHLKHPLAQCSPSEIACLRKVYASIRDGNSTWEDYVNGSAGAPATRSVGTPRAKESASAPAPAATGLSDLLDLADDKGVTASAMDAASHRMFGKLPHALNVTELQVLRGWVENGGKE